MICFYDWKMREFYPSLGSSSLGQIELLKLANYSISSLASGPGSLIYAGSADVGLLQTSSCKQRAWPLIKFQEFFPLSSFRAYSVFRIIDY
jgi:hypothetical protein